MPGSPEHIRELWLDQPAEYVRQAAVDNLGEYPVEVQKIIFEVAQGRGIISPGIEFSPAESISGYDILQPPLYISSGLTFFVKFIFPLIFITLFGLPAIEAWIKSLPERFPVTIFLIAITAFLYWSCMRLKRIKVSAGKLYISNYFKTIEVDVTQIKEVSENCFIDYHPVWITFKEPTRFGKKIMFMPQYIILFFGSHPVVALLRNYIEYIESDRNVEAVKHLRTERQFSKLAIAAMLSVILTFISGLALFIISGVCESLGVYDELRVVCMSILASVGSISFILTPVFVVTALIRIAHSKGQLYGIWMALGALLVWLGMLLAIMMPLLGRLQQSMASKVN